MIAFRSRCIDMQKLFMVLLNAFATFQDKARIFTANINDLLLQDSFIWTTSLGNSIRTSAKIIWDEIINNLFFKTMNWYETCKQILPILHNYFIWLYIRQKRLKILAFVCCICFNFQKDFLMLSPLCSLWMINQLMISYWAI